MTNRIIDIALSLAAGAVIILLIVAHMSAQGWL